MSEFTPLEERIKNLTVGLLGMVDGEKILVNKAFLEHVRDDMVELSKLRRAQPANDSLTLDEMWEMGGEIVWCVRLDTGFGDWRELHLDATGLSAETELDALWDSQYGQTWFAYRRKPEPEGGAEK